MISSCGSGVRFRPDTRLTPRSCDCTPFPGDSPPRRWAVFEEPASPTELMMAADLFALASRPRSEGLPTVVLEAMAAGVPVVATDVGSIAEVVHDDVNGRLVGPDDPVGLARAIDGLVADTTERHRLGKAGRVAVTDQALTGEIRPHPDAGLHQGGPTAPTLDGTGRGPGRPL